MIEVCVRTSNEEGDLGKELLGLLEGADVAVVEQVKAAHDEQPHRILLHSREIERSSTWKSANEGGRGNVGLRERGKKGGEEGKDDPSLPGPCP